MGFSDDSYDSGVHDTRLTLRAWLQGNPQMLFGDDICVMWSWCLANNLAVAAGLLRAHLLGHERGLFRPSGNDPREIIDWYISSTFRPGHALPATREGE